ncbi:MAG: class I SAM-dependent methyltransferase, partial [Verrucomicrobiota bacterium]
MKALASKTYWSKTWKEFPAGQLPFSPTKPGFRDFHRLFQRVLEEEDAESLLEIGCYPGRFLWYFNQTFKLKVSGLEYIDWACQKSETLLRENGIEAELIHGDLFEADMGGRTWDIVASFGFIEHFTDLDPVLRKHLDLLKPGGLLLLTFPNHTGFNGRLFRWI